MNDVEIRLKELIIQKYGSLAKFCEAIDMPWTTLDSILKRGVEKANITNILKITRELNIDVEELAGGRIIESVKHIETAAAHFDGSDYTPEQLKQIKEFAAFVKQQGK